MSEGHDDIVVIGERNESGELIAIHSMTFFEYQGSRFYTPREVGENGTVPSDAPIVVRLAVEDPENQGRAEEAAAKLIQGVVHVLNELADADPNINVQVLGRPYSVGELLADLTNTNFTVTDQNNFQNNGVGAASRGALGQPNTDIINMDFLLDGYTNEIWPLEYGLTVLILHEMGHISSVGWGFFNQSVQFWNSEPADQRGSDFYAAPADYARNVEKFANDFKNAMASAIGVDAGWNPGPGVGAVEPSEIYQNHMGDGS